MLKKSLCVLAALAAFTIMIPAQAADSATTDNKAMATHHKAMTKHTYKHGKKKHAHHHGHMRSTKASTAK